MMDDIIVDTHRTLIDSHQMTRNIRMIAEGTGGEVGELREQVAEVLRRQKSLQVTLNSISGKNGLLQFLMEHLSKSKEEAIRPMFSAHLGRTARRCGGASITRKRVS
jgi:hypothetical protein